MYLTYEEYVELGGTLDETAFNELEYEARACIDWITFNRLHGEEDIPDEVKQCMYHLIKLIKNKLDIMNTSVNGEDSTSQATGSIASQSNDGVSVSYNVLNAKDIMDISKNEINDTVSQYLQGVRNSLGHRLLFRGLYPGEIVK